MDGWLGAAGGRSLAALLVAALLAGCAGRAAPTPEEVSRLIAKAASERARLVALERVHAGHYRVRYALGDGEERRAVLRPRGRGWALLAPGGTVERLRFL
jgi:hypothetical protein